MTAVLEDRARTDMRQLVATIDGMFFWSGEQSTREHILEQKPVVSERKSAIRYSLNGKPRNKEGDVMRIVRFPSAVRPVAMDVIQSHMAFTADETPWSVPESMRIKFNPNKRSL